MSLAFMIKAHSSRDCRRIRILSIQTACMVTLCLKSTDCSLLYLSASLIFVLSGLAVEGLARENLRERK